jgi:predicted translin family RNA/ssDNA-binding protein
MFLQLSSRDATTYVYKKSIFEINNDIKKNYVITSNNKNKMSIINAYVDLYKTLFLKLVNGNFSNNELFYTLEKIYKKINCFEYLNDINNLNLFKNIIDVLFYKIAETNVESFFDIVLSILKKITKNSNYLIKLYDKTKSNEFNDKINESHDKFISWFLN